MARNDGVSARTKRGLVQSGAMTEDELGMGKPARAPAPAAQPTRGIGKQITQAQYDAQVKADKARADANRQAAKDRETKRKIRGY